MITREQVADLQPGDVVCVTNDRFPDVIMQGPLMLDPECTRRLRLGATVIRCDDGTPLYPTWSLTVVSRAPRPLYINHPRTLPVAGDVVGHDKPSGRTWFYAEDGFWRSTYTANTTIENHMPRGMRLLVDGSTGEVVQ